MRILSMLLFVFVLISCQNQTPEARSEQIAKGICDCSAELMEMNKQAAKSEGPIDFEGIEAAFTKTKACIAQQHMKSEDRQGVEKSLAIICPELAAEFDLLQELIGE